LGIARGKRRDLLDYDAAGGRVENFVEPIEVKRRLTGAALLVYVPRVESESGKARFQILLQSDRLLSILLEVNPKR
jgi:hypothetical protein